MTHSQLPMQAGGAAFHSIVGPLLPLAGLELTEGMFDPSLPIPAVSEALYVLSTDVLIAEIRDAKLLAVETSFNGFTLLVGYRNQGTGAAFIAFVDRDGDSHAIIAPNLEG